MNLSILIHTFNGYSFLWEGLCYAIKKNWLDHPKIYFATDTPCENDIFLYNIPRREVLYSDTGSWSDRLTRTLNRIETDYVLYMQEDHYPTKNLPDLAELMRIVTENQLLRLQISPVTRYYTLYGDGIPLFFDQKSKYLVSHQPSIWKKSFFLDQIRYNEDPWLNEYEGTKRLNNNPEIKGKIAIYPYDWYKHMCIKGKIVE